jgi:hypothetical protein
MSFQENLRQMVVERIVRRRTMREAGEAQQQAVRRLQEASTGGAERHPIVPPQRVSTAAPLNWAYATNTTVTYTFVLPDPDLAVEEGL